MSTFADALAALTARLDPAEAASLCGPAARSTAQALAREKDRDAMLTLAKTLAALTARLDPAEAATLCGSAARTIADSLERDIEPSDVGGDLIDILNSLTIRLGRTELAITARSFVKSICGRTDSSERYVLARALSSMAGRLDPTEAVSLARSLADAIRRETDADAQLSLAKALVSLSSRDRDERAIRFMTTVLQFGPGGTLAATVRNASLPEPRSVPVQDLVELLKMPTLIGDARRVVLDELGQIHGRRFANHWEFVRFAREKGLKLDFTSPPRRPDPK